MNNDEVKLRTAAGELAGSPVETLRRIGQGGNSRVCLVRCRDGQAYVAKTYLLPTRDGLDRLDVEFRCLRFLASRGVGQAPRPVAACPVRRMALYEPLEGDAVATVGEEDVLAATRFLLLLRELSRQCAPTDFQPASEACFSFEAVVANLRRRVALLRRQGLEGPLAGELAAFLDGRLAPAVETARRWLDREFGQDFVRRELPLERRLLSPSDFGFHNALRAPDGELRFVDFEYFGWDDPAKTVSDFLLHPAMSLSLEHKRVFVEAMLRGFDEDADLGRRILAGYPLFGLKWCLIVLNEFMASCWRSRLAAGARRGSWAEACAGQLAKARARLDALVGETACGTGHECNLGAALAPYRDLLT